MTRKDTKLSPEMSALFGSGSDWAMNACVNISPGDWYPYVTGYRRGGDLLADYVMGAARSQDVLVFPIVFLYRHYLELRLKDILLKGDRLSGRPGKSRKTHRLSPLWADTRLLLESLWGTDTAGELDVVGERIAEFDRVDKTSVVFRYPADNEGAATEVPVDLINLRKLKDYMAEVGGLLDGASLAIEAELEARTEFEQACMEDWS